jgi:hypothetical protein
VFRGIQLAKLREHFMQRDGLAVLWRPPVELRHILFVLDAIGAFEVIQIFNAHQGDNSSVMFDNDPLRVIRDTSD